MGKNMFERLLRDRSYLNKVEKKKEKEKEYFLLKLKYYLNSNIKCYKS
jgi:hypothetical protein